VLRLRERGVSAAVALVNPLPQGDEMADGDGGVMLRNEEGRRAWLGCEGRPDFP
jgi:hypothetical protein